MTHTDSPPSTQHQPSWYRSKPPYTLRFPNYCENATCTWHWRNRSSAVKEVGICLKKWAADWESSSECPHYRPARSPYDAYHTDVGHTDVGPIIRV